VLKEFEAISEHGYLLAAMDISTGRSNESGDMEQAWFEMLEHRRRKVAAQTWIPLRAFIGQTEGMNGYLGYKEDFLGVVSVAVPTRARDEINELTWGGGALSSDHGSYAFRDGRYKTAESFQIDEGVDVGIHLVLEQRNPGGGPRIWHLNQDLVFALRLIEEKDAWVSPDENFVSAVRRERRDDDSVGAIYIRADFLRDYLAARGMALRVLMFRQRTSIEESSDHVRWEDNPHLDDAYEGRFEGRKVRIHPGGDPEGATMAVFNVWRTDVDDGADIPEMGPETDEGTASTSRQLRRTGPVIARIDGEFWRNEWIEPAAHSPRVRGDHEPSATRFIVDNAGTRMSADELYDEDIGKWLWFDAAIVRDLLSLRSGDLSWYTRDTGTLTGEYGYNIHFGVNSAGLINVYAYDIAKLSEWHRRIWASRNMYPEGGLSEELAASQIRARPADTVAPEAVLPGALERLATLGETLWGVRLFREHSIEKSLIASIHRFRATDRASLLELAKDIARLTADRLDIAALHRLAPPPDGRQGTGSLRSLERLIATLIEPEQARAKLTVLAGIYDLRVGAAHLPGGQVEDAFELAGIDKDVDVRFQALQMIKNLTDSLVEISNVVQDAIDRR
jgi:hypothetical protein